MVATATRMVWAAGTRMVVLAVDAAAVTRTVVAGTRMVVAGTRMVVAGTRMVVWLAGGMQVMATTSNRLVGGMGTPTGMVTPRRTVTAMRESRTR